jgi:hypothetical protein
MKRCSECEFTFEDHQQFCDFDGTELTVVPEPFPSFKKVPVPVSVVPSIFLRVARSRVSVAVLALGGVMLSAVLIGYFESGSQPNIDIAATSESRNEVIPVPQDPSESLRKEQPEEVASRFISTQRTINADENSVASSKKKSPSTSKSERTKRRFEKTNRELLTRNQKSGSRKANQKIGTQTDNSESVARNQKRPDGSKSESSHQRGDSKFVAILKKTGRILKRPFEF